MTNIVNILHLLTDNCHCHVEAHSTIKSRAPCNITVSDTFTTCKYTLTSSANNFTIIPWLSDSFANLSMYTRNKTGPMPLLWTTPLRRLAVTDRYCPTLVWCVRFLRKFWSHHHKYHIRTYFFCFMLLTPATLCELWNVPSVWLWGRTTSHCCYCYCY